MHFSSKELSRSPKTSSEGLKGVDVEDVGEEEAQVEQWGWMGRMSLGKWMKRPKPLKPLKNGNP